jgi:hypothetical protein
MQANQATAPVKFLPVSGSLAAGHGPIQPYLGRYVLASEVKFGVCLGIDVCQL